LGRTREFHSRAPFAAAPARFPQHAATPVYEWLVRILGLNKKRKTSEAVTFWREKRQKANANVWGIQTFYEICRTQVWSRYRDKNNS